MAISYTLIVALMYITILSFGIANLLSLLAQILNRKNDTDVTIVHLNWIIILLIIHFNMAWGAVLLATVDSWSYYEFLVIVLGPILAFFTSNVIAPNPNKDNNSAALVTNYINQSHQFFILFGMIQAWVIGTEYMLQNTLTGSSFFNILLILLAIAMFQTDSYKKHIYGVIAAWAAYLTAIALRSLAVIN